MRLSVLAVAAVVLCPLPIHAQEYSAWEVVAGDPTGQSCAIYFSYARRDERGTAEGHVQYWYRVRNDCPRGAKLRLAMQRADGFVEEVTALAGRTVRSWTYARTLTGAGLVAWDGEATRTRVPASEPRADAAEGTARGALAEWSGKVRSAVAKQNEWARLRWPDRGQLLQSYGEAINRARQDVGRLEQLLQRTTGAQASGVASELDRATREVQSSGGRMEALEARLESAARVAASLPNATTGSISGARSGSSGARSGGSTPARPGDAVIALGDQLAAEIARRGAEKRQRMAEEHARDLARIQAEGEAEERALERQRLDRVETSRRAREARDAARAADAAGDWATAEARYLEAIELLPTNTYYLWQYTEGLDRHTGSPGAGDRFLRDRAREAPDTLAARLYALSGSRYHARRQWQDAVDAFEASWKAKVAAGITGARRFDDVSSHADAYRQLGAYAEAVALYRGAIAANASPESPPFYHEIGLAGVLHAAGQSDAALRTLQSARAGLGRIAASDLDRSSRDRWDAHITALEDSIRRSVLASPAVFDSATWRAVSQRLPAFRDSFKAALPHAERIYGSALHPTRPIGFIAVYGPKGASAVRGIYRSSDGGRRWAKVLYLDEHTGFGDVVLLPSNASVVYATNDPSATSAAGLWRSRDGGETWENISTAPAVPPLSRGGWFKLFMSDDFTTVCLVTIPAGQGAMRTFLLKAEGEVWHERPKGCR